MATRDSGAMTPADPDGGLPLPEGCVVRELEMGSGIDAVITQDADGAVRIFLNARLDGAARRRALRHELWHYYRGDLNREGDIREIEAGAPAVRRESQGILAIDGTPLPSPAPAFGPGELYAVGRGVYLPVGDNLRRAARDIRALCAALDAACGIYDVLQTPPLVPVAKLRQVVGELRQRAETATAFIAWRPPDASAVALPVALQFCEGSAEGALYYDADGRLDNALTILSPECGKQRVRLTFDLRRQGSRLGACAIHREIDGRRRERIY